MIEGLALLVVVLAGSYLLALGAASLLVPARAGRFLLGFAGSPFVHFVELLLRMVVGAALVVRAPHTSFPGAFHGLGWLLLATTACLLLIPWGWHRRFALRVVPLAIRYIALVGAASLTLGGLMLVAVLHPDATWP